MGQFLTSRFNQPQPVEPDGPNNPEATWWCRLLARAVGTVAGVVSFICGIVTMVSLSPICIVAALMLMLAATVVLVFEAPICCSFLTLTKPIAVFAEKRTFIQKAIIYVVIAIVPLMCFGLSTIFGCGLIFTAGVIYGLMGLGKKADRQQMITTAATTTDRPGDRKPDDTQVGLIDNEDAFRGVEPSRFVARP